MGHDVIAGAETHSLQHGSQNRCRTNHAIVQQIGMRQMPRARKMPAARTVSRVLSGELRARAGVEHMRVAVELTLEGLPIDQTDRTAPGNARKRPLEGATLAGRPVAEESAGQPPFRMTALTPKYCRMNQTRAALVIWPPS